MKKGLWKLVLVFQIAFIFAIFFTYKELSHPKIVIEKRNFSTAVIKVPAVDENGNGVMVTLMVGARGGEGRVLVDINQLLFWIDTQNSIQTARDVAKKIVKMDLSNIDLIYSIKTNASIIGGPSAGAALTVATIAALENKTLNPNITITGTINLDGSIGAVGEIAAKAKAAKEAGMKMILVPAGQGTETRYKQIKNCKEYGYGPIKTTYCEIEVIPEKIEISEEIGIKVVEVAKIEEVLKYFFP